MRAVSFHPDVLLVTALSQHNPTQDLQSYGALVAQGSRCSADARPGTEAPSLKAWLAVLEGDPGWQPFLSPYLEQLSGSCWAPTPAPHPQRGYVISCLCDAVTGGGGVLRLKAGARTRRKA